MNYTDSWIKEQRERKRIKKEIALKIDEKIIHMLCIDGVARRVKRVNKFEVGKKYIVSDKATREYNKGHKAMIESVGLTTDICINNHNNNGLVVEAGKEKGIIFVGCNIVEIGCCYEIVEPEVIEIDLEDYEVLNSSVKKFEVGNVYAFSPDIYKDKYRNKYIAPLIDEDDFYLVDIENEEEGYINNSYNAIVSPEWCLEVRKVS